MAEFMILEGCLLILSICCLIADHIFPRIKSLNDFIDSLSMMVDDEESDTHISRKENNAA